jgi:choline dehydrogenase-like flavoprotein
MKNKKIALIEAGEKAPESLKVPSNLILPLAGFPPSYKKYNWFFETEGREKYLNQGNKKFYQPRGKVLGGTS